MSAPSPASRRRRILVMRYRFIGDTLLLVPFLRQLRAAYPDARIDLLAAPNSGELLRDCPYVDELIMFDTTRRHRYENPEGTPPKRSFWSYVKLLRARRYETAFVLKRSFSSAALAFLAGIPERIGFDTEHRGWLLTQRVPYRRDRHEIDSFLSLLQAAGLSTQADHRLESWQRPEDKDKAEALLAGLSPEACHLVLHLTSSNAAKQWPDAHALQLVSRLLARPQIHLHALGAASDAALYEAIKAQLPKELSARWHVHCGRLNLNESMAFLSRMKLVVGVDSGTLHMAAAAGVPVVALFGPMDERQWAPPGAKVLTEPVACRPCHLATPCRYEFQCMTRLQPDTVLAAIEQEIGAHAGLA